MSAPQILHETPIQQPSLTHDVTWSGFRRIFRDHGWAIASLFAITLVIYWPTLSFAFVNWDDPWYVVNNELIRSWSPANLFKMATESSVKNYAPLTMFSLLVDQTLWGDWAGGFHLTNFLLHAVNGVLVYLLVGQMAGNRIVGWMTAALFVVHPVQIETVAWVSSRKGLLSATFILLCLIRWLRPERTPRDEGMGLLFLVLALLTKAIAVVVPAVILLYDVLMRRDRFSDALARQFIPGLIALAFLFGTMASQTAMYGGVRGHMALGKLHILAVDSIILWQYVGMLVWPSELCVLYDPPTSGIAALATLSLVGWGLVVAVAYRFRRRYPAIAFTLSTALVLLLPVLNLTPITTLMNDRYLYLPCIALFGLFALGVDWTVRNAFSRERPEGTSPSSRRACPAGATDGAVGDSPRLRMPEGTSPSARRSAVLAVGLAIASGLTIGAQHRLPVWKNATSLWEDAATKQPQMPLVQYQLATGLYDAGEKDRAIRVLHNVIATGNPDIRDRERMRKKLDAWRAAR